MMSDYQLLEEPPRTRRRAEGENCHLPVITWHKENWLHSELLADLDSLRDAVRSIRSMATEDGVRDDTAALSFACDECTRVLQAADLDDSYVLKLKAVPLPTFGTSTLSLSLEITTANQSVEKFHEKFNLFLSQVTAPPTPAEFAKGMFSPFLEWEETVVVKDPAEANTEAVIHACIFGWFGTICMREHRSEAGTAAGDPYLQAARVYQIILEQAKAQDGQAAKCPVVILLVLGETSYTYILLLGPLLWVCGGISDGHQPVVEPLAPPYVMLDDGQGDRQENLARLLYAVNHVVRRLYMAPWHKELPVFNGPPGVPRVFKYFQPIKGEQQPIEFSRRLGSTDNLLFEAASPGYKTGLVVKFCCTPYGVAVQSHLASLGLAPAYYGDISLEATPKGHVMELMTPPVDGTPGPGRIPLSNIKPDDVCDQTNQSIRTRLEEVLQELEAASFLHADLRTANILIYVNDSGTPDMSSGAVSVRVVDFDWAGKTGEAVYPMKPLSENSGSVITTASYDRMILKTWWPL